MGYSDLTFVDLVCWLCVVDRCGDFGVVIVTCGCCAVGCWLVI